MERRCYRHLTDCLAPEDVEEVLILDYFGRVGFSLEYSPFLGEKGAHGGDLGLPAGDGGGQGGQAPAGQVQGEQQQHEGA